MEAYETEPMELQEQEIEPLEIEPVARPSLRGQQMELLPSFDDIHLAPEEPRIDHDDEVIPRRAPMHQRLVAGLVDVAIVFLATGAFALTFVEAAEQVRIQHDDGCMLAAVESSGWFFNTFFWSTGAPLPE